MTDLNQEALDPYLERLRASRGSSAVLKARLVAFRSTRPGVLVFAFEGQEDKIVYYHWIRRLRPGLQYEPFPCDGKKGVRELKEIASRDLSGIQRGLYYFVDRDFDDLNGFVDHVNVFVTDMYSVENYLVSDVVLEEALKNEFPCHAEPVVRDRIGRLFLDDYMRFLELTKELNFRIFLSKRLPVNTLDSIPSKLSNIAIVNALGDVRPPATSPDQVLRFADEPDTGRVALLKDEFNRLEPAARYRGKFSYKFFHAWLLKLAEELRNRTSNLFDGIDRRATVRSSELVLGSFAAKSEIPINLREFLDAVAI